MANLLQGGSSLLKEDPSLGRFRKQWRFIIDILRGQQKAWLKMICTRFFEARRRNNRVRGKSKGEDEKNTTLENMTLSLWETKPQLRVTEQVKHEKWYNKITYRWFLFRINILRGRVSGLWGLEEGYFVVVV